jgi:hypothetical protein
MPQHENAARARAERMFKLREFQKADASKATADYHAVEQRLRDRTQELRKLRLLRKAQSKRKLVPHLDGSDWNMRISSRTKTVRNRVDISSKELTRHWCKYFGTSKDKIEAAVAKVGDNPETVQKDFRPSIAPVSMSLAGSRFSSDSALGPLYGCVYRKLHPCWLAEGIT